MGSPTNNSSSCTTLPVPVHRQSTRLMLLTSPTPVPPQSRSGGRITPPVRVEMSITEQIARQTRKSTVLDPKNALLIMAIPDYDDYKVMQPYSCRSLSNRSKFVGGRDFITRHNPQEVNDFKKQYSRDIGNLNRHRSILAPPTSNLSTSGLFSSSSGSIGLMDSPSRNGSSSNNNLLSKDGGLWRKTFTSTMKACWVLTDVGLQILIGPEYRLTTRAPVLPVLPSPRPQKPPVLPLSSRSPAALLRPDTPSSLAAFSARESARKGIGVDLADEKVLAALSRLAVSTPKPRTPPCSPSKRVSSLPAEPTNESAATLVSSADGSEMLSLAPYADISWERKEESDRNQCTASFETNSSLQQKNVGFSSSSAAPIASEQRLPIVSSMSQHFAMEVSPPMLALGTLQADQVYLFPVRVRNVGFRQERFRVNRVVAKCAGFDASIAEASYQRESARLAPGLAAILGKQYEMEVVQGPVEAAVGNEGAADPPTQSDEDRRWGFVVGEVVQIAQGRSQKHTYALYCGQGRVIHVWTPSRQSFRIRVDSLRGLQRSGYKATASSTDFDAFFLKLLDLSPCAPTEVIQRAKTALHATPASRVSNLSFILFARYGDSIFVLSESLKMAYGIALHKWMFGSSPSIRLEKSRFKDSPLDDPVRLNKRSNEADSNTVTAEPAPAIVNFLGTNGEHLLSEWLWRSLAEFNGVSARKNPWFAILMPSCLSKSSSTPIFIAKTHFCYIMPHVAPLFLLYDKPSAEFRLQFLIAGSLSERMAGDRMECGLMMEAMALEDKAPTPVLLENESTHDEDHNHVENPRETDEEPEPTS
ncbi:unnamed protein product [Phytophthora fragariaefolia]|uniref:Unnamed protein product n=1 Tax=Phytophthora fragariaefolia TaxID=1490495 RepID=A0A9W6XX90_9STRA|nr:unnamed protein product [Phytophthora fragariaefolia]